MAGNTHFVGALVAIALGSGVLWWTSHHALPRSGHGDGVYIRELLARHQDRQLASEAGSSQELCQSARQIAAAYDRGDDAPRQRKWRRIAESECKTVF